MSFVLKLSQDCLENFFAVFRRLFGFALNPTPIQFERGFQIVFISDLYVKSIKSSCDDDFDKTLAILNEYEVKMLKAAQRDLLLNQLISEESDEEEGAAAQNEVTDNNTPLRKN